MNLPKLLCFIGSGLPFGYCAIQVLLYSLGNSHHLGADPGEVIVHFLGKWGLVFLLATLAVTPLQQLLKWRLVPLRRMLGLYAFFYVLVHLSAYLLFLLELNFSGLGADVIKRPYITVGMLAFLGLIPLAITSNRWMQRKLRQNWKRLHRLVYPIAILAVIHLAWQVRSDYTESLVYGSLLALLLGYRILKAKQWM